MPPDPDGLILSATAHSLTIGTPINGEDLVLVPGQVLREFTRADLPGLQRRVLATADEQAAVRAESNHVHGADVAAQSVQVFAVVGVPQLDVVVETGGSDRRAVGRECDVVDLFLVADQTGQGLRLLARCPQVDGAVVGGCYETLDAAGWGGCSIVAGLGFGALA